MLVWWIAWVGFLYPAHTRGAVSMDGRVARTSAGSPVALFFSAVPSCCSTTREEGKQDPAAPTAPSSCMVCKLVGNTVLPPTLPPYLTSLRQPLPAFPIAETQVRFGAFHPTFRGRAPPASGVVLS
jgi:hypothetical protein